MIRSPVLRVHDIAGYRGPIPATTVNSDQMLTCLEKGRLVMGMAPKAKGNLLESALEILQKCEHGRCHVGRADAGVIAHYNLAALIHYHLGCLDNAARLCWHALEICEVLSHHDPVAWAAQMIQPWINIGRIASARGNWEVGLSVYAGVFDFFCAAEDLAIGGIALPRRLAPMITARFSQMAEVAKHSYVTESVKALLIGRQYQRLIAFSDQTMANAHFTGDISARYVLLEAKARAFDALGQYNESLRTLRGLREEMSRTGVWHPGIYVLIGNVYHRCQHLVEASKAWRTARKMTKHLPCGQIALRTAYLTALGHVEIGQFEDGYSSARHAYEMASAIGEESSLVEAVALIIQIVSAHSGRPFDEIASRVWFQHLSAAAEICYYWRTRAVAFAALASAAPCCLDCDKANENKDLYLSQSLAVLSRCGYEDADFTATVRPIIERIGVRPTSTDEDSGVVPRDYGQLPNEFNELFEVLADYSP